MDDRRRREDLGRGVLERELAHVRGAIALVATGAATRVVLGGLRFGEPLIETARVMAREAGLRLVPLWSSDESGADLAFERDVDA